MYSAALHTVLTEIVRVHEMHAADHQGPAMELGQRGVVARADDVEDNFQQI